MNFVVCGTQDIMTRRHLEAPQISNNACRKCHPRWTSDRLKKLELLTDHIHLQGRCLDNCNALWPSSMAGRPSVAVVGWKSVGCVLAMLSYYVRNNLVRGMLAAKVGDDVGDVEKYGTR